MPKKVISNTTPLINLLKIDRLGLLESLYGEIFVPFSVYNEVEEGKKKTYYTDLKKYDWIKIIELKNESALKLLIDLDKGEAETIAIAQELDCDLVLMDEKLGRRHAKNFNLTITGTLGILIKAKQLGLITNLTETLTELKSKGTYFNEEIIIKHK